MKKAICISLLLCSAIFSAGSYAKAAEQSLDQIVAVVNDDVITDSELNHALATTKAQLSQEQLAMPPATILYKQVLDQLINKRLQLQIAQKSGVQISDAELDSTVERIAQQNNMSVEMLYERINGEGMTTEEYRHEMRDQLTMQKLQQQEVAGKVTISKEEITGFMHSRSWKSNGTKEYHLEDILIPLSDTPSSEEIVSTKQRADSILAKLKQGQPLRDVALADAGAKNTLQSDDLGWRQLPEIPSAFTEEVTKMQNNAFGGPIQTPNGFHILRMIASRNVDGKANTPDKKQIENLLLQQKFEEAVRNWVSKLRSQAFIDITTDKVTSGKHGEKQFA